VEFFAFANLVASGIMNFQSVVRPCVSPEQTFLTKYLGYYLLAESDQTFTTNGLWGKYEHVKFWHQKVTVQGHGGVKYALKCTFWSCSCHLLAEA